MPTLYAIGPDQVGQNAEAKDRHARRRQENPPEDHPRFTDSEHRGLPTAEDQDDEARRRAEVRSRSRAEVSPRRRIVESATEDPEKDHDEEQHEGGLDTEDEFRPVTSDTPQGLRRQAEDNEPAATE